MIKNWSNYVLRMKIQLSEMWGWGSNPFSWFNPSTFSSVGKSLAYNATVRQVPGSQHIGDI